MAKRSESGSVADCDDSTLKPIHGLLLRSPAAQKYAKVCQFYFTSRVKHATDECGTEGMASVGSNSNSENGLQHTDSRKKNHRAGIVWIATMAIALPREVIKNLL